MRMVTVGTTLDCLRKASMVPLMVPNRDSDNHPKIQQFPINKAMKIQMGLSPVKLPISLGEQVVFNLLHENCGHCYLNC